MSVRCENPFCVDGFEFWYQDGQLHRDDDLPAVTNPDGTYIWYKNGKIHRDNDLPAVVFRETYAWYKNGLKHRSNNKPAVIYHSSGEKEWWIRGKRQIDPLSISWSLLGF